METSGSKVAAFDSVRQAIYDPECTFESIFEAIGRAGLASNIQHPDLAFDLLEGAQHVAEDPAKNQLAVYLTIIAHVGLQNLYGQIEPSDYQERLDALTKGHLAVADLLERLESDRDRQRVVDKLEPKLLELSEDPGLPENLRLHVDHALQRLTHHLGGPGDERFKEVYTSIQSEVVKNNVIGYEIQDFAQNLIALGEEDKAFEILRSMGMDPLFIWDYMKTLLDEGDEERVKTLVAKVFRDQPFLEDTETIINTPMVDVLYAVERDDVITTVIDNINPKQAYVPANRFAFLCGLDGNKQRLEELLSTVADTPSDIEAVRKAYEHGVNHSERQKEAATGKI